MLLHQGGNGVVVLQGGGAVAQGFMRMHAQGIHGMAHIHVLEA